MSENSHFQGQWTTVAEGEWAGWTNWPSDTWENNGGPFYARLLDDGSVLCAFRAEAKHMNGQGHMHGGCMMTFADFAAFALAANILDGPSVTVTMNCEFIRAANIGDLVEATGEVVKAGRSMVFVRGLLSTNGKPIMTYSATLMRLAR